MIRNRNNCEFCWGSRKVKGSHDLSFLWVRLIIRPVFVSQCWGWHSPYNRHLKWIVFLSINNLVDLCIRITRDLAVQSFYSKSYKFYGQWVWVQLNTYSFRSGVRSQFIVTLGTSSSFTLNGADFETNIVFMFITYIMCFLLFGSTWPMFCFTTWLNTTNLFRVKPSLNSFHILPSVQIPMDRSYRAVWLDST